jgi:hypothetical protein
VVLRRQDLATSPKQPSVELIARLLSAEAVVAVVEEAADATYCTMVATREGQRSLQQGLSVEIPADVLQVVDRMTPGESCAAPTRGSSSWPTLGANYRDRSYKLPCVVVRTEWVERKPTAKDLLLVWDLPATTIKNASVVVGNRLSQDNMVPFKIRIHVAEAIRVALTEGTNKGRRPRDLSFAKDTVDGKRPC